MAFTNRPPKWMYYAKNYLRQAIPAALYRAMLKHKLMQPVCQLPDVQERVNYYNQLQGTYNISDNAMPLSLLPLFKSPKAYAFDAFEYLRYFKPKFKANWLFGDITHTPSEPTLQKSRPLGKGNQNAVLLNLDKYRHFLFVNDKIPFSQKKNELIGRGVITQPHRIRFMEMYFGHALCNLGQVNKNGGHSEWLKDKLSIQEHLKYKFILSLEGNDVATNLKWIMSSNSVAVMPRPRYETWFMEGRLIANHHYICIADDYSDLEEKLQYFIKNPAEAEKIVKNANTFVKQFLDKEKEDIISLMVLNKYFKQTCQSL